MADDLPYMDSYVLDISILSSSSPKMIARELEKLKSALISWGCIQVINHGMSTEYMDEICNISKRFFELPSEEKEKYAKTSTNPEGYGTDYPNNSSPISYRLFLKIYPEEQRSLDRWPMNPQNFGYPIKLERYREDNLQSTPYLRSIKINKLNFDGSVINTSAAAGVIIRDHLGNVIAARTYNLGSNSSLLAEAIALRNGLILARSLGITNLIIEGDNLTVISIFQGKYNAPWKLHIIMDDIRHIISDFTTYSATHVFRERNTAADYLASLGHYVPTHQDIDPFMDSKFSYHIIHDRNVINEYAMNVRKLHDLFVGAMAKSLELEEDKFLNGYGVNSEMVLRINYYPPFSDVDRARTMTRHSDVSALTFLLKDRDVEALEVLKDDQWFKVPVIPNAIMVIIGDQIEMMSNGIFKSVEHRVRPNLEKARISLALFCSPDLEEEVGPLKELVNEDQPPLYKRVKRYKDSFEQYYTKGLRPISAVKIQPN